MKQYLMGIVCCFFVSVSYGQISYGGQPLLPSPLEKTPQLRSSTSGFFIEMPPFDVKQLQEEDRLNEEGLRGGFRFANKFMTNIERGKDGLNYQLADGTRVWQVGIRSKGAYSINVLFGEFDIPEGGKLFIYNSKRSHVIGSFTSENNCSDNYILPTQPIEGDEIIVEYTEPGNATFEGKLKIIEVNHDYRDVFLKADGEPDVDKNWYPCMTDVTCAELARVESIRSTVLLIINGNTGCTGTLINNTKNDEAPYILTAVHCLNLNPAISRNMDYYKDKSGTIVTFFNYQRSVCSSTMRGIESQTVAGSTALAIIEKKDIALLRLNETPPDYYNPYFAGWNIEANGGPNPHINLHHPLMSTKKSGNFAGNLVLATSPFTYFDPQSHWKVSAWTTGATAGGSSGSALFDGSGLVIGGLSGGGSQCNGTKPNGEADYFFALNKGWEYGPQDSVNLKHWLDPNSTGATRIAGFDPLSEYPMVRLSNANYNANPADTLINTPVGAPGTGYYFGHNSLQETNEYAEMFNVDSESEFVGAYLLIPPISNFSTTSPIKINVYSGENGPETLIKSMPFNPVYTTYSASKKGFDSYPVSMGGDGTENFVVFPSDTKVKGKFYVSYEISYPSNFNFAVYNTSFGSKKANTAWIKKKSGEWFAADKYPGKPITTSLAIQPLIIKGDSSGGNVPTDKNIVFYYRSTHTLYIDGDRGEIGTVTVYSLIGQALQTFAFAEKQSFTVYYGQQGAVGIVRINSNYRNSSTKIIF